MIRIESGLLNSCKNLNKSTGLIRKQRIIKPCLAGLFLCLLPFTTQAELKLPALISDNMVLQQHHGAQLWGQAEPGSTVAVKIAKQTARALTSSQGIWQLHLPHLPAGNHTLTIEEQLNNETLSTVQINDVAVGEVWLASGQSNMAWPLGKSSGLEQALESLKGTDLRFFVVTHRTALELQDDVNGYWIKVTAENASALSGIALHFAQQLHLKKSVPIGIIQSAWSDTKAEAWTSLPGLQGQPALQPVIDELQQKLDLPAAERAAHEQKLLDWEAENFLKDPGITQQTQAFSKEAFDDSAWPVTELPTQFKDLQLDGDGVIWFRRSFTLPDDWSSHKALLSLGKVDDFDQVFLNGKAVGQTDRNTAYHWLQPRKYEIDASIMKPGLNTLAVRVLDRFGGGGFTSLPQDMFLKSGINKLPLSGAWKYQISVNEPAVKPDWASIPAPLFDRNTPTTLYNAMIAPLTPYTIQGVIWYQGESDAKQAERYRVLFPALIRQWRQAWQRKLPFLFVQLANFNLPEDDSEQRWTYIRAIQADTGKSIAGAGMVTAIDVGEADSIHPTNKKVIGQRLANLALATVYGEDVPWHNPECGQAVQVSNQQTVVLQCDFADGLHSKGEIISFELAGSDGQFHLAKAVIDGVTLRLSAAEVIAPTLVRYGWHNNPLANIYNSDGLPLMPLELTIQTDF